MNTSSRKFIIRFLALLLVLPATAMADEDPHAKHRAMMKQKSEPALEAAEIEGYEVAVSTGPDFASTTFDSTAIQTSQVGLSGLETDRTYYWRVRSQNRERGSSWSFTSTFTVGELGFWSGSLRSRRWRVTTGADRRGTAG